MSDATEPECLIQMGEGLATIEPELIYNEGKRQYEALLRARHGQGNSMTTRVTRQRTDLSLYYRNLWENVTRHLEELQKIRLMHICFAYKTRAKVLQFLGLLDGEFEWAGELNRFVREYGSDTAFYEPSQLEVESHCATGKNSAARAIATSRTTSGPLVPPTLTPPPAQLLRSGVAYLSLESMLTDASKISAKQQQQRHYFIIPTLPIALPTSFFSALGSQSPIDRLTVSHMLAHPSVLLLALSPNLKSMLRDNLPDFWKATTFSPKCTTRRTASHRAVSSEQHQQEREWKAFFEHLLAGQMTLVQCQGDEVEGEDDGYGLTDLALWIAGWVGARQVEGNAEKGLEERARIRLSAARMLPDTEGDDGHGDERGSSVVNKVNEESQEKTDGQEEDSHAGVLMERRKRKRVSWNETPEVLVFNQKVRKKTKKQDMSKRRASRTS